MVRGRGANTGNWYYGTYFCHRPYMPSPMGEDREKWENETKHYIIFQQSSDWGLPYTDVQVVVDPTTLGQCTGMHVKTTKGYREYLYEGDIVKFRDEEFEVVWDTDIFRWILLQGTTDCRALVIEMVDEIVKVGNKYDLERKD